MCPTCVPPQSSIEYVGSIITTRTISPYFSPNKAIAPVFTASSFGILLITTGMFSLIFLFTIFSTCSTSSSVIFAKWLKSKRKLVPFTKLPFCATWVPNTVRNAACIRCVAVWCMVIFRLLSVSTVATIAPVKSLGMVSAKCIIKSFSFFVSKIANCKLPIANLPLSPTCPPLSA